MPTFQKQFQDEIRRLVRKETKDEFQRLKQENVQLRRIISSLKKELTNLKQRQKKIQKVVAIPEPSIEGADSAPENDKSRISSTTVKNLRSKLGLTQADFGKLLGVSGQSVYQWERQEGQLQMRNATRQPFLAAKPMGKRDAKAKLEGMG